MSMIEEITGPKDVKRLSPRQREELAEEIRQFLVENVSRTGGHLGPNLGVVELTIALHTVFESPSDVILFDTGHQTYVHKILTGRTDFTNLRQKDGLTGYPSRAESEHDVIENSHATTALSWADGIARSLQLEGDTNKRVVAVIGDGAMTGGMAWEALNNIAQDSDRPIVIVLNDNGRSYAPTIGGIVRRLELAKKLDELRVNRNYENLLDWAEKRSLESGKGAKIAYGLLHSAKKGLKDIFIDAGVFDYLGIKYIGPVDGHNIEDLEEALTMAKNFGGPIVVHAITEKGRGYEPAEENTADHFHTIGKIHPETGLPIVPERFEWTRIFAEEILEAARQDEKIVGITAAMLQPVGLDPLRQAFPSRVIDVGIAEQHAVTMAAGFAYQGYHPVLALYATFLNRGFDQLLMDVALHKAPVTIMLDRAGVTGPDGASHNGVWDLSLAAMIPGLRVAAPRDEERMRELFREALAVNDGPTIVRYPKGEVPTGIQPIESLPFGDVIARNDNGKPRIAIVAVGSMCEVAVQAAGEVDGCDVSVLDPRWALPIRGDLIEWLAGFDALLTIEDGMRTGGVGQCIASALDSFGAVIPVQTMGVSSPLLSTATREEILSQEGMTVNGIVRACEGLLASF
ncbi:MAG: 1-deoxy-D-xylulose-5-phosphate synthase [Actinomycetaceae bacterium]|nr:1-deoxy-D-xylulose-5-phosphate synthase [Actinomycetaceae bacterium]